MDKEAIVKRCKRIADFAKTEDEAYVKIKTELPEVARIAVSIHAHPSGQMQMSMGMGTFKDGTKIFW